MSWRLEIVHRTMVSYQGSARASCNEARMTPLTLATQTALETRFAVEPASAGVWRYRDYWGTLVNCFDIQAPHEELVLTARAVVDTRAPAAPGPPPDWAALRERAAGSELAQYLTATPRTTVSAEISDTARGMAAAAAPHTAASGIASWVRERVAYVPGSTGVQTGAQEAWDQGQGVCQDIAHLTVALLRVVGLPARYVSGYLHPQSSAGRGETVAGQGHAWVEYWAGEWVALDPTNDAPVGERHVIVGRGRDYADVAPLKGVYQGAPRSVLAVAVDLTRLA